MTVRRERSELRALTIAAALLAPIFLTGCATPYTHLQWGTQTPSQTAHYKPKPRPYYDNHRYTDTRRYTDDRYYGDRYADNVPVPTARPSRQYWYDSAPRNDDPSARYDPPPRSHYDDHYANNSSVQFAWPVRGRVIEEFGSSADGQHNDGINIAAEYGTPIHAAADGTVSYSGNELRSYGNLVLVRHENGYVTAYAHAERFVVEKGDHVTRGQVIGYVGSSGDVRGPQLHFELRRGARDPIDPRSMLGAQQVASRD